MEGPSSRKRKAYLKRWTWIQHLSVVIYIYTPVDLDRGRVVLMSAALFFSMFVEYVFIFFIMYFVKYIGQSSEMPSQRADQSHSSCCP